MTTPGTRPEERGERTSAPVRWTLSPALAGAIVVGLLSVVAGFVLSRVEPALVGAPLLIAAAVSWRGRPGESAVVVTTALSAPAQSGSADQEPAGAAALDVEVASSALSDAVHLRLARGDAPPVDALVTARAARRLRLRVPIVHSGPQRLLAVLARPVGGDAAWVGGAGPQAAVERVVSPIRRTVRSIPLPARLLGLTGQHTSSRPGEGGEFRDIDVFRPGDRLRRIDWKATARAGRQGELYVRRTTATSDAAIHLVLDSRDDLTGLVADWSRVHPRPAVSSLDLAREAAAALAAAYAAVGDRVGFDDVAVPDRVVPPRAGARHRERVLAAVASTRATGAAHERVRPPRLAPGAIVYLFSTFLDDQPVRLALSWRAAGHRVIAVDVLPKREASQLPRREGLALRALELERELRLGQLAASGAELMPWHDPTQREARLSLLARPRRAR